MSVIRNVTVPVGRADPADPGVATSLIASPRYSGPRNGLGPVSPMTPIVTPARRQHPPSGRGGRHLGTVGAHPPSGRGRRHLEVHRSHPQHRRPRARAQRTTPSLRSGRPPSQSSGTSSPRDRQLSHALHTLASPTFPRTPPAGHATWQRAGRNEPRRAGAAAHEQRRLSPGDHRNNDGRDAKPGESGIQIHPASSQTHNEHT